MGLCCKGEGGFVFGGSSGAFVKENVVLGWGSEKNKNYLFIFWRDKK